MEHLIVRVDHANYRIVHVAVPLKKGPPGLLEVFTNALRLVLIEIGITLVEKVAKRVDAVSEAHNFPLQQYRTYSCSQRFEALLRRYWVDHRSFFADYLKLQRSIRIGPYGILVLRQRMGCHSAKPDDESSQLLLLLTK